MIASGEDIGGDGGQAEEQSGERGDEGRRSLKVEVAVLLPPGTVGCGDHGEGEDRERSDRDDGEQGEAERYVGQVELFQVEDRGAIEVDVGGEPDGGKIQVQ